MPRLTFNALVYLLIFLVGALNYALMLGTLELIEGYYPILPSLDLLRSEASFFLFIAFISSCYLIEVERFVWLRRIILLPLLVILLLIAHTAAVLGQITAEAGPMHKVLFYVNYLKLEWLNNQGLEILLLYIIPGALVLLLVLVYFLFSKDEVNGPFLKKKFYTNVSLGVFFLALGFMPPLQTQMPYSLSHNALLYVLKTGYFPQKDIYSYQADAKYTDWQLDDVQEIRDKNLVFIVLESTQKKAIHIPGLESVHENFYQNLSPYLSELSKQSVVFNQAYGSSPHTSKALVSIHCGILPYLDLPIYESVYGLPVRCLPELLKTLDYKSVFLQGATAKYENRRELLSVFGYDEVVSGEDLVKAIDSASMQKNNPLGLEDKALISAGEKWLKHNKHQLFFMSFLTLTTHHPYLPPQNFKIERYLQDDEENNYLNAIRYQDDFIRELITMFKQTGTYENTLFVFVSDHGEAFGEHGERLHNNVAYNEVAQVFLMLHDGSRELAPQVISNTVSQLQILPTLLDVLNIDFVEQEKVTSVFREDGLAFGSCYERIMCFYVADNDYKYIYNFREKAAELYDIKNDPLEKNDLIAAMPGKAQAMHEQFMQFYSFHQSAMHNYYKEQNPAYQEEVYKAVLYSIDEMKRSLQ